MRNAIRSAVVLAAVDLRAGTYTVTFTLKISAQIDF